MSQSETPSPNEWPLPRVLSFAAMLITCSVVMIFLVTAFVLHFTKPNLGDQPLLLPLLGAVLMAGTMIALLGLIAGLVDLTRSKGKRGITVLAVTINGLATLFIFSITMIGLANS